MMKMIIVLLIGVFLLFVLSGCIVNKNDDSDYNNLIVSILKVVKLIFVFEVY